MYGNISKILLLPLTLFALVVPSAVGQSSYRLSEVEITAPRPMKEIGVQKTVLDSAMLKENIALSMADVLTFNSSVFVKNHGRATLSTVAFRGTSPSHTQVTWNGMKINSPMLGMTDFSIIPSFFIDNASLLHGTSSVTAAGGGLGGLVSLSTSPSDSEGSDLQYIQGAGSFRTFDEFARFSWANDKWSLSTRAVYSSSANDYKFINHDKKLNIYDDNHNIIGQYHPEERNRSGAYKDLHILQEAYYKIRSGDRLALKAWFINSNRELPLLTTDYGDERDFENKQRERTFRGILSWDHNRSNLSATLKAGYIHTWLAYDYRRDSGNGILASMTRSRSNVNTLYGQFDADFAPSKKWFFTLGLSAHQHFVKSKDRNVIMQDGNRAIIGYDKARLELSAAISAKWQPVDRLGLSVVMRGETAATKVAPLIPAFFFDALISRKGNLMFKASASRNYRFPSLNDLYFLPGGNPKLKSEKGFTYDAGMSFQTRLQDNWLLDGSADWFDSYIDDWIMWLPTPKGFFSPRNVKKVHAYGVEVKAHTVWDFHPGWRLDLHGSYSFTPSVNRGEKYSEGDRSVGKQLPYVPRNSASVTGRLSYRSWAFLYKWVWYSKRYTMSSNEQTISGQLPQYFMSNVSLERDFRFRPLDLSLKLAVNNLFNEDYLSVLSRPMPGINFEFFISIRPRF